MTTLPVKAIHVSPSTIDANKPFANDAFNRKIHADRLTNLINRLPDGGVIAIDAPWGEGKSWFGENWRNQLKVDGYRTAYINAFERDYVEDPFVMLVAEITDAIGERSSEVLKSAGLTVAKALAPMAGKIAFNAVFQLFGTSNIDEKVADAIDNAGEAAGNLLGKRIDSYKKDNLSVINFRKALADVAKQQGKPIVIFIDELDRCRPDFAVKTIERIKHFFEIKNVVFILLINQSQLHSAIQGLYGDINAQDYLSKFLHITLTLPKLRNLINNDKDYNTIYINVLLKKYGYDTNDSKFENWAYSMAFFANYFDMSYRDLERSVTLLSVCGSNSKNLSFTPWLIALKLKMPKIFFGIKNKDKKTNIEAYTLLNTIRNKEKNESNFLLKICSLHQLGSDPTNDLFIKDTDSALGVSWEAAWENLLPQLTALIDCEI